MRSELPDEAHDRPVAQPQGGLRSRGIHLREVIRIDPRLDDFDTGTIGPAFDHVPGFEVRVGDIGLRPRRFPVDRSAIVTPAIFGMDATDQDAGTPRPVGGATRHEHMTQGKGRSGDDVGRLPPDRPLESRNDRSGIPVSEVVIAGQAQTEGNVLRTPEHGAQSSSHRKTAHMDATDQLLPGRQTGLIGASECLRTEAIRGEDRNLVPPARDELLGEALHHALGTAHRRGIPLDDVQHPKRARFTHQEALLTRAIASSTFSRELNALSLK